MTGQQQILVTNDGHAWCFVKDRFVCEIFYDLYVSVHEKRYSRQ